MHVALASDLDLLEIYALELCGERFGTLEDRSACDAEVKRTP